MCEIRSRKSWNKLNGKGILGMKFSKIWVYLSRLFSCPEIGKNRKKNNYYYDLFVSKNLFNLPWVLSNRRVQKFLVLLKGPWRGQEGHYSTIPLSQSSNSACSILFILRMNLPQVRVTSGQKVSTEVSHTVLLFSLRLF